MDYDNEMTLSFRAVSNNEKFARLAATVCEIIYRILTRKTHKKIIIELRAKIILDIIDPYPVFSFGFIRTCYCIGNRFLFPS